MKDYKIEIKVKNNYLYKAMIKIQKQVMYQNKKLEDFIN